MNDSISRRRPSSRRRPRNRRFAGVLAATVLALAGALVPAGPASAADGPFSIDGTVPDVTPAPAELTDPYGNVKELGPKNASTTKIGVINKANAPMLDSTNPNAQVDLRRAWLTTARDSGTQHDWLYFAWERDSNSGSGFIAYEFMQDPVPASCNYAGSEATLTANCNPWKNRRAGDFLILWDQSGSSTQLSLRTWSGTAPNLTLSAAVPLDPAVSQAAYSADKFRGEAAVDLTATVFGGTSACRSFANTIPSTVTGNSDTADYKDTILKQAPPITNCTSTVVTTPKLADGVTDIPVGGADLGPNGTTVTDSAVVGVVGGTATPGGSVSFYLCEVDAPGVCGTDGTSVGSTNLSGNSYPATVVSPSTTVTEPGRYCWRAEFSGDSSQGIPSKTDFAATECFVVNAVASSLSTAQSWVPNDSATISAPAGGALDGTASFTLYPTANCTGSPVFPTEQVAVAGTSPRTVGTSNTTAVTASGSFSWSVSYDSSNVAQKDIPASCHETSALTVTNGGTVSSP